MSKEIRVWQIEGDKLKSLEESMQDTGRTEPVDLQNWIRSRPELLGDDIIIIGEQVSTRSGPMDFLGVDDQGNTVVVELKRDMLPREALAQAIDYASEVASWDLDRLSLECSKFHGRQLPEYLNETRGDVDWELVTFNEAQRLLLVGTGVEESLQRMIEWLSDNYAVSINAVIFRYVRTAGGDELLVRTVIVPEEVERQPPGARRKFAMSDVPGNYSHDELRDRLAQYLSEERDCPRRVRKVVLPMCLASDTVSRDELVDELLKREEAQTRGQAGRVFSTLSRELGMPERDYLRQVIQWREKAEGWRKESFYIPDEYKPLVREVLDSLEQDDITKQDADAQGQLRADVEEST